MLSSISYIIYCVILLKNVNVGYFDVLVTNPRVSPSRHFLLSSTPDLYKFPSPDARLIKFPLKPHAMVDNILKTGEAYNPSIALFKVHIKSWYGDSCNCNMCK